jgi:hypothetical protein
MRKVVILTGDTDNLEVLLCPEKMNKTKDLCLAITILENKWNKTPCEEDEDDDDDEDSEVREAREFADWLVEKHGFERVEFLNNSMV